MTATLKDLRVETETRDLQGTVVLDDGHDEWVRVRWDDQEVTWSRRDLLYLVGEWSS
jgi:hypothetical protein